jgi:predicted transcriptional regulator
MAIQPRFAQAILNGTKTIEFRKRALAPDIQTVLIYETTPTQQIVGEFDLKSHEIDAPAGLWRRFKGVAGIDADAYDSYFAGHPRAVGMTIAAVRRYDHPVSLSALASPPSVPQSFTYLDFETLATVRAAADGHSLVGVA